MHYEGCWAERLLAEQLVLLDLEPPRPPHDGVGPELVRAPLAQSAKPRLPRLQRPVAHPAPHNAPPRRQFLVGGEAGQRGVSGHASSVAVTVAATAGW